MVLAQRINDVLPAHLVAIAEGAAIGLMWEGELLFTSRMLDTLNDGHGPLADQIRTAVFAILSGVQDAAILVLREPWPVGHGGDLALPNARVEAGKVYAWFGEDESRAAVSLEPIGLPPG